MRMPLSTSSRRAAAAELDTDVAIAAEIARARQHEIAETAEAGQRVAPPAFRARKPRDFDQAARDERRHRVVAEAEPLDHAGGDRDHVLQRAADLDAGDVVAHIQAQARPAELLLDPGRGGGIAEAASTAVGRPRATSEAKLGPESTTTGKRPPVSSCDHLRHASAASPPRVPSSR